MNKEGITAKVERFPFLPKVRGPALELYIQGAKKLIGKSLIDKSKNNLSKERKINGKNKSNCTEHKSPKTNLLLFFN